MSRHARDARYLAWVRKHACCACGSSRRIEAAHVGPHGLGQKASDYSTIPLCAECHRTGRNSYHALGPVKFQQRHDIDFQAILTRLHAKPVLRIECGRFVARLGGEEFQLGPVSIGPGRALEYLRKARLEVA